MPLLRVASLGIVAGVHGALRYTPTLNMPSIRLRGRDNGHRCGTGGGSHLVEQLGVVGQALGHRLLGGEQRPITEIAGGFVDAVRQFIPPPERLYTWWSYRARDWAASNRGRRLDHIWMTPGLVGELSQVRVLRDSRSWPKASDHVPVMVMLGT